MSNLELSPDEIREFCQEWQAQLSLLEGKVDSDLLSLAQIVVQPDNFGYEQGNLRPDRDLARYDLLGIWVPVPQFASADMLLICRISAQEATVESRDAFDADFEEVIRDLREIDPLEALEFRMTLLGIPRE